MLLLNPYRFASDLGNPVLLLHCNGSNGSTTFTDSSPYGRTQSAANSATISTSQSKFGGASLTMAGSGKGVQFADFTQLTLGTQDWWVGFFYRFGTAGTRQILTGQSDSGGSNSSVSFFVEKTTLDRLRFVCCNGSTAVIDTTPGSGSLSTNTWYWVTAGREGTTFRIAVDGVGYSVATSSATLNDSSQPLAVGSGGDINGVALNGFIDEYIMEVGEYRGLMTTPTGEF